MKRMDLFFERPDRLQATTPPEARGIARDEVRLLVSRVDGHVHTQFTALADYLTPGDLLVVNRSATIPASLTATSYGNPSVGTFTLNFSTNYGGGLWLVEEERVMRVVRQDKEHVIFYNNLEYSLEQKVCPELQLVRRRRHQTKPLR